MKETLIIIFWQVYAKTFGRFPCMIHNLPKILPPIAETKLKVSNCEIYIAHFQLTVPKQQIFVMYHGHGECGWPSPILRQKSQTNTDESSEETECM